HLASRLGAASTWSTDPAEVFDELARASAGGRADYSGLSHVRLEDEAMPLYWPCPRTPDGGPPHPGTPRLFLDRFPTADGRARLVPVEHDGPADDVRADAPVYLVTGRVLQHYQSGAQTRRVPELDRLAPAAYVELHPLLAQRLDVSEGDLVRLSSARGAVEARVRLTPDIRTDTVFMPFHWGGAGSANRVTSDATDPISGMPAFKVCAVEISRVPLPVAVPLPDDAVEVFV
ncbi:MAG TPA: molybdopterin oxidoreductase family protein, partial [Candidatus Lustribacter sp.]|nr:molybdopterin oxidoreductase family protein [Candidatus Lustribacter sp.]